MVSGTHIVEKTIDSINGLTVDQPTDPYHGKNADGISGLTLTDPSYTAKLLASVNLAFNVFPQKTLTWGQLFRSLLLWNSILFYYVILCYLKS